MKNKFWKIKNLKNDNDSGAEILLYGEISSESWYGDEVTPKEFAQDIYSLEGVDLTIRINSPGGDVFAATAIYNILKRYQGNVTCYIDGLAASAATIVAMGADKVVMPNNALFMIHNPATLCIDFVTAEDLEKMKNALDAVKNSILEAYSGKCKLTKDEISKLMDAETWMSAKEAKEKGFCDEIEGEAEIAIDGKFLVVNSAKFSTEKFKNFHQELVEKENNMSIIEKLNEVIDELKGVKPEEKEKAPATPAVDESAIINQERARIAELETVEITNDAVKAIVTKAKANGSKLADIKEYIDAVKDINLAAQAVFAEQVEDNKNSGVEGIAAGIQSEKNKPSEGVMDEKAFGDLFK